VISWARSVPRCRLNRITGHSGRLFSDPHAIAELTVAQARDYFTPAV
jgi:hypothetical protein